MWHWDQGRLAYFQYDNIQKIARFVLENDFKKATSSLLQRETKLAFAVPETHSPWRNYSRVLKLCLLVSEKNNISIPTSVATMLATPGLVTSDEYFHFLASVFTEPSPALTSWTPDATIRYPLLFSLKYMLAKFTITKNPISSIKEIIGAYKASGFIGTEGQMDYVSLMNRDESYYESLGSTVEPALLRQARESLFVLAQISYLYLNDNKLIVSLAIEDAHAIFDDLIPPIYFPRKNKDDEIIRLAELFKEGSTYNDFDYPNTTINDVIESGFIEGGRIKKTHIVIERNLSLTKAFFEQRSTTICDICNIDTCSSYPWSERIIDLHHLLPLASGTRVNTRGTTFDDLVALCPNCHRATHRFYDSWLRDHNKKDFQDNDESNYVYKQVKSSFKGFIYG